MSTDIVLFNGENDLGFDRTENAKSGKFVILEGKDIIPNRKILENKRVDILLSPEKKTRKDSMHHRNSGLNQVLCKIAKKNNIAIGFSFNEILHSKKRFEVLGKMMQNVKLCRKYKLKMVFGSFAKNKWELRSKSDLESFAKVLGMSDKEAQDSLSNIENILKRKKEKWIRKGVRIIE